jgi:hypothetical protein
MWGILQDYYHTEMFPQTKISVLSTIGGLCNFVSGCVCTNDSLSYSTYNADYECQFVFLWWAGGSVVSILHSFLERS